MGAILESKKIDLLELPDLGPIIKPLRMIRKDLMEKL
jgi:hypothetical protein